MSKQSMLIRMDWKFIVTLIASVAGLVIPLGLWYADLASHSARVRVISQTALKPDGTDTLSGLKISMDGHELEGPYLTVLVIENNGTRAIPASDFESPMEIKPLGKVKIARAQVTTTLPKDIQPALAFSDDVLKMQPLLLNPGDSITVALVTSGGLPGLSARARIAGISSVAMEDKIPKRRALLWLQSAIGFSLLIGYAAMLNGLLTKSNFQIRRRTMLLTIVSSLSGGIMLLRPWAEELDLSYWEFFPIYLLISFIAIALGFYLNRMYIVRSNNEQ